MSADMPSSSPWLQAAEAAAMLGVQRASLYSYVSRGLLKAQRLVGRRGNVYLLSDVQRLVRQRQAVRNPAQLAQSTLDWGQAVLDSAITLVRDGQLYYRGHSAVQLAQSATLEETAMLLWQQSSAGPTGVDEAPARQGARHMPRSAAQALATWFGMATVPRNHLALLHCMGDVLLGLPPPASASSSRPSAQTVTLAPLHQRLAASWQIAADSDAKVDATNVLRSALVLCADHELNASSFATRVVASTGASLHASVGAGLAALSGPLHGGMTRHISAHWDEWHGRPPKAALAASLQALLEARQTGQTPHYMAGFGHPLYPSGDPRSAYLLALLPFDSRRENLIDQVHATTGLHPSLDYSLVAIERALRLPPGAAFVLFALGRTVGWIAHALEQQATGQLIRPRAQYTGAQPATDMEAAPTQLGRIIRF
ncbi:citrate synthase family protein [Comamonas testosteroni]|uniref:citrate synthase family protein n=1 Tax=Comamonas testosteroni TaxID=285 RepID=UPI000377EF2A|nr:citrate synthase family protein [Comamonas testosteroni]